MGRRRILHNVSGHRPWIRRALLWSLAIGLIGVVGLVSLLASDYPIFREQFVTEPGFIGRQFLRLLERFGSPAIALLYVGAIALVAERIRWKRWLCPLVPVGRMALTNYLLQSVFFVILFFGYGFGLMDRWQSSEACCSPFP